MKLKIESVLIMPKIKLIHETQLMSSKVRELNKNIADFHDQIGHLSHQMSINFANFAYGSTL